MLHQKLEALTAQIRTQTNLIPKIAIVLGSGLGPFAEEISVQCEIPYHTLEGFPVSTIQGHEGKFILGTLQGVPVIAMKGRVHYYEGYSMEQVVLPIRVMLHLGAKILMLTNAAGGINTNFSAGDLMVIQGQISSFVPSPLIGPNDETIGTRFPDMTNIYDETLQNIILKNGEQLQISLQKGVYLQTTGPQYETPEEIKMFRLLGADAVGMSTACEAIAARHMGAKVCGISCITNLAAGMSQKALNHEEVAETAKKTAADFSRLVSQSIADFGALI